MGAGCWAAICLPGQGVDARSRARGCSSVLTRRVRSVQSGQAWTGVRCATVSDGTPPSAESRSLPSSREGIVRLSLDVGVHGAVSRHFLSGSLADQRRAGRSAISRSDACAIYPPTRSWSRSGAVRPCTMPSLSRPTFRPSTWPTICPENLAEIDRWRNDAPGAMNWSQYSRLVLELEGRRGVG